MHQFSKLSGKKKMLRALSYMLVMILGLSLSITAFAKNDDDEDHDKEYKNKSTGYVAYIDDRADLITSSQEKELLEVMKDLTEYGNVAYLTMENYRSSSNTEYLVKDYFEDTFGRNKSGFVFCAHCDKSRQYEYNDYEGYDYVYVDGAIGDRITRSLCLTLTDNVYDEYYFDGAMKMFPMATTLMRGGKIAQPMKVTCNILLALLLALLINYFNVSTKSSLKKATNSDLISGTIRSVRHSNVNVEFLHQTRTYSPQSSGSGGGGHGGGHGGGGHGGGHSH